MFNWLKRKKTVDDIIAESFSEPGRWFEESNRVWVDTKTGARLCIHKMGGHSINDVPADSKVVLAYWDMLKRARVKEEQAKRDALERLYANN